MQQHECTLFLDLFKDHALTELFVVLFEFDFMLAELLSILGRIDQSPRARLHLEQIIL